MILVDNNIYLGGNFSTIGGIARSRFGAVDATTGALNSFINPANNSVQRLLMDGSKLHMGGQFSSSNGSAYYSRTSLCP